VVSGFVAEHWNWRVVYAGAAVGVAAVGLAAWRMLPRFAATTQLGYGALLASLAQLWRAHPALRRATAAQALLSVGFSAFWSTLAVMLQAAPFHIGASVAGAFGLAGAAGALAAPLAGRLADRSGPGRVARLGAGLAAVSFVVMGLGATLPVAAQLVLLALGAVAFDLGGAGHAGGAPEHRLRHRPGRAQPAQRGIADGHVRRHGRRLGPGRRAAGTGRLGRRDGIGRRRLGPGLVAAPLSGV
jgi:predicted MFS family arabinose efflux permease